MMYLWQKSLYRKMIKREDFEKVYLDSYSYYRYRNEIMGINGIEICLEPCFVGLDIGIYDLDKNLLFPKMCIKMGKESKWDNILKILNSKVGREIVCVNYIIKKQDNFKEVFWR